MIHCWTIGKKVARIMHRAIHRTVHRLRHHYHSLAVKIVAPAMVCVSTATGLGLWPASAPPPAAGGPGLPGAAVSPSPAPVPVDGGMFVALPPTALMELPILVQLSEVPAELLNSNIDEMVPFAIESSITEPSQIASQPPQSVPEPSSILLLGVAISLFVLIRHRER
jgi:hypothetical protein